MGILSGGKNNRTENDNASHWISVSDLMSALMMIFLLVAVFYIVSFDQQQKVQAMDQTTYIEKAEELENMLAVSKKELSDKDKLLKNAMADYRALVLTSRSKDKQLSATAGELKMVQKKLQLQQEKQRLIFANAVVYDDVIKELHQSLLQEFSTDFEKWNAELREDLTFRFNEPTVLFDVGMTTIKPKFKKILDDFFPRYIQVINSEKFRNDVVEVRIEGHTSSFWGELDPKSQEAYFNNMQLSQGRSRSTLSYVMKMPVWANNSAWLKSRLIANGLSSSKPVDKNGFLLSDPRSDGVENAARSQRVEFRVRIDAESKITKVIEASSDKGLKLEAEPKEEPEEESEPIKK